MKKVWYFYLTFLFLIFERSQCYTIKEDESIRSAIYGGRFANIRDAPYHVALIYNGQYICGGALITLQHVLTAAHCVTAVDDIDNLKVYAGSDSLDEYHIKRNVRKTFTAKRYNEYEKNNDIGFIVLTRPFKKSNVISPVSLPRKPPRIGEKLQITGFGRYSPYTTESSRKLKKLVSVVTDCNQMLPLSHDESDLCLKTTNGRGICNGDSGSPLVNQKLEIVGIASRGLVCGQGVPDIYTSVYDFLRGIHKALAKTSDDSDDSD